MLKHLQKMLLIAALCVPWVTQAQTPGDLVSTFPYSCDFETASVYGSWVMENGTQENGWYIGTAVNATTTGTQSLYVSSDTGVHNVYSVNTATASYSWAYQRFAFPVGTYSISFSWRNFGEIDGDPYDFFRVFIVPDSVTLTAGTLPSTSYTWSNEFMSDVPTGWIGVNGTTTYFVGDSTFNTNTSEFAIPNEGNYKLVFLWLNDDNACYNPAAAVDDIAISLLNSCPSPVELMADASVNDSVVLWWSTISTANSYNLAIVPMDSVPDDNFSDFIVVYDTTYVVEELEEGYYDAYIRSSCSDNEVGGWFGPVTFSTVPEYFMSETGNATLYTCNMTIYDCGGADGPYTMSNDSYLTIYPTDADHVLQISGYSYTESTYDYLQITDLATNEVVFCDNATPNGQTIEPFVAFGGVKLYFHSDGSVAYDGFEVNVTCVPAPNCSAVRDVDVVTTAGSAMVTWRTPAVGEYAGAYVQYKDGTSDTWTGTTVTDDTIILSGLDAGTEYDVRVMGFCSVDDSTEWVYANFTTDVLLCIELDPSTADTTVFSTSTTGQSGCLAYSSWGNTAYQTIYTADELTAAGLTAGEITGIDLGFTASTTYNKEFTIFLGNSNTTSISTATLENPNNHTLVYGPALHPIGTSGIQHYDFDVPFTWDGVSSIMLTTFMNQYGSSQSSSTGLTGYYVDAPNKACFRYKDSAPFTLVDYNSGNSGSNYSYRAAITFYKGDCQTMATCSNPLASVSAKDTDYVSLSWLPGYEESSWNVDYRQVGDTDWIASGTAVSTNEFTVNNLTPGTIYEFRVWHECESIVYSDVLTTATLCVAEELPFFTSFEADEGFVSGTSGTLPGPCWNKYTNYSTSYYPYVYTTYAHSGSNSMYMYTYTYNSYAYFTLPRLSAQLDNLLVSFWLMSTSSSYPNGKIQVGVMSDPYDYSTFIPVDEFIPVYGEGWRKQEVALSNYNGPDGNIAFVCPTMGSTSYYSYMAVDDITVDYIPECMHPTNIHTTMVEADSMRIVWTPGGDETQWSVSYDDTYIVVEEPEILLTELDPNIWYNFTITSLCGGDDTNSWEFNARSDCGKFTSLPYTMDFEREATGSTSTLAFATCWTKMCDGTTRYPYISASTSYNHTDGGSKGLYWYATNSSSYGNYQIIVLPEVDTTVLPVNNLMLSFWAKPSSSSYEPVFYVGVMSDLTTDTSFIYYDTVRIEHTNTDWHKYTVTFDRFEDSGSFIAIRTNMLSGSDYWYAYMDDITLDVIPQCSAVEDLNISAGPQSALVSWTVVGNNYDGAVVEYKESSSDTWSTLTVNNVNYASITGLTPMSSYDVRVSASCEEVNSMSVTGQFFTRSFECSVFDSSSLVNANIGTGETTTTYLPSYSTYNYGYTQQFVKASELGDSAVITRISVFPTAVALQRTYEIYLGYSSDTASSTYITPNYLTCVYNGGHIEMVPNQWLDFQLTTPFNYVADSGNLVVIFRDLTGSWVSGNSFRASTAWNNVSLYSYRDDGAYTVPPTGVTSYPLSVRCDMQIFGGTCLQSSTCAAPPAAVVDVTPYTVDIAWTPGNVETAWNLYYRLAGADDFTLAAQGVTSTAYQFSGLMGGTNYEFMVVPVCSDSLSTVLEATTECAYISSLPYTETFNTWGVGSGIIPNCWYRTSSYSTYTYITSSYNHSGSGGGSIYMYQSGTYHSAIFLPALDTNVVLANQTQLVFHALVSSASYLHPGFEVGVMSNPYDITTFVPVDTVYHTVEAGVWQVFEVPLANYAGDGAYVGLRTVDNPNSGTEYTYTYPYLDDFTLEMIPTCPRPDSLMAGNATTTTVDLNWHERGDASNWIVEYGPIGFTLGTGTQVAVNSNPFTLSGLPVAYQGEYYVRSVCGVGDTGEYSRSSCLFATSQIPGTLPYDYNYETATEWANWQTCSNTTTNWYRGTAANSNGNYSMYISADSGATYSPYQHNAVVNAAAYRDIDFGTIDSSFTISFDARVGGTLSASYDGLMVFLVDPSLATVASNSNITSPWGNVNDLYRVATVRIDTNWNTYSASFDTIHGIHRVAFFWFNQNTEASYPNLGEPAAIDNIHIDYSACPRPVATTVTALNSTSATLTWVGPSSATYEVIYREYPNDTAENHFVQTNTNSITLTGLETLQQYAVWVRKICGNDTSMTSDRITFITAICDGAETFANYDATMTAATSTYSPIGYSFYNYGYTQTIIDSAHLAGMTNEIVAMSFESTVTTAGDKYQNMTVYLANVSENDLSSGWILPDSNHIFVKVIDSADFSYTTTGQHLHEFDTSFAWDGHSNILVAVVRDNGSYSSGATFAAHNQGAVKGRYAYRDSPGGYDYTNPDVTGTPISTIGDIYLLTCGIGCAAPDNLSASNVTYQSATMNWMGSATDYEFAFMAATDIEYPEPTTVSGTTYAASNLQPATTYRFHVRALCDTDEGLISDWVEGTFVTDSLPCFAPTNLTVGEPGYTTASFSWTENAVATQWYLHVWNSNFDTTYVANTNPFAISGLEDAQTFYASVRSNCNGIEESDNSDTVTFTTATCAPVTGVAVSNITPVSALVTWTGSATTYEVQSVLHGYGVGQGTQAFVQTTQHTLSGLDSETEYDVYVRAVCETGVNSQWSQVVTFTTTAGQVTTYTITATANDATMGTVSGGGTYPVGTDVTLTAIANPGYVFVNWNDGVTTSTRTITVTGDASYVANFEAIPTYTITVSANNPDWGTVTGGGTFEENTTTTITATANAGYLFASWDDGNTEAVRTITVTADHNYVATFVPEGAELNYYDVTVTVNDPAMGTVTGGGTNIVEGSVITLTATANAGYRFVNWNDGVTDNPRQVTVNSDMTFTANFEALPTYTITVNVNDPAMGTVTGGGTYPEGTEVTLTATPNNGYEFVEWNDHVTTATRVITVTADATYTATFRASQIGIAEAEGMMNVSVYPNPATSTTTVALSGVSGDVTITVVDMNGRVVKSDAMSCDGSCTKLMEVGELAQGAYFIRVSGENVNMVKKLVVK